MTELIIQSLPFVSLVIPCTFAISSLKTLQMVQIHRQWLCTAHCCLRTSELWHLHERSQGEFSDWTELLPVFVTKHKKNSLSLKIFASSYKIKEKCGNLYTLFHQAVANTRKCQPWLRVVLKDLCFAKTSCMKKGKKGIAAFKRILQ